MTGAILVLSGGGAKAAAHCGAVRALRERGIEPSRYVATSLGAVVAAALAAGAEPDTVVRALMNEAPAGIRPHPLAAVAGIHLEGLVRAAPFREAIARIIGARRFADLKVPLTVTAVDVDKLELVVFGHGGIDAPLLDVLAATCALPPYFPAVRVGGRLLRDGGLMGHLPLSVVGETGGQPVIAEARATASVTRAVDAPPRSNPTSTAHALPSSTRTTRANSGSRIESVAIVRSPGFGVISILAAPARKRLTGACRVSTAWPRQTRTASAPTKARETSAPTRMMFPPT